MTELFNLCALVVLSLTCRKCTSYPYGSRCSMGWGFDPGLGLNTPLNLSSNGIVDTFPNKLFFEVTTQKTVGDYSPMIGFASLTGIEPIRSAPQMFVPSGREVPRVPLLLQHSAPNQRGFGSNMGYASYTNTGARSNFNALGKDDVIISMNKALQAPYWTTEEHSAVQLGYDKVGENKSGPYFLQGGRSYMDFTLAPAEFVFSKSWEENEDRFPMKAIFSTIRDVDHDVPRAYPTDQVANFRGAAKVELPLGAIGRNIDQRLMASTMNTNKYTETLKPQPKPSEMYSMNYTSAVQQRHIRSEESTTVMILTRSTVSPVMQNTQGGACGSTAATVESDVDSTVTATENNEWFDKECNQLLGDIETMLRGDESQKVTSTDSEVTNTPTKEIVDGQTCVLQCEKLMNKISDSWGTPMFNNINFSNINPTNAESVTVNKPTNDKGCSTNLTEELENPTTNREPTALVKDLLNFREPSEPDVVDLAIKNLDFWPHRKKKHSQQ